MKIRIRHIASAIVLFSQSTVLAATFEFFQVRDAAHASAWSKQTNIQVGSTAYGDEDVTITALPEALAGLDWIRSANASRVFDGYDVVKTRIDAPGATDLHLFIDQRVTPAWLADYAWKGTGDTLTLSNGAVLNGYRKLCFQGSMLSLEGLNDAVASNYILIAKPTTVPGPTGWARADAIVAAVGPPAFREVDYNVTTYGATGDNTTDNYAAFKSAVDACAAEGGGRVLVPAGKYAIHGPVELKSGVRLHLSAGAQLLFRGQKSDYLRGTGPQGTTRQTFNGMEYMGAMSPIHATHASRVAVTGDDPLTCIINAGWNTVPWTDPPSPLVDKEALNGAHVPVLERIDVNERPIAVTFQFCDSVWVEGIQINKSPFWCLVPWNCDKVLIKNTRIISTGHNNDGITPLASTNVVIDGCFIDPGDDAFSLKSMRNEDGFRYCRPLMDVVIQNCSVKPSNRRLLEIGSETSGGVKNIFVRNLTTPSSTLLNSRVGIKMSFMRAGFIEDVYFKDSDCGAFHIWKHSGNDNRYDYANQMNYVRDIYFESCPNLTKVENLFGKGPPYDRPHIDNVRFIDCPVTVHPADDPKSFINVDYNATGYGPGPAPAVDAGPDQSFILPAAATLVGIASAGGASGPLTTTWSKRCGPGDVSFGDASAASTTAAFSRPGLYVLRLTASDGALAASDEIALSVNDTFAAWSVRNNVVGEDDDHDGASALMEYGRGTDPHVPDFGVGPDFSTAGGYLTLTYRRSPTVTDLSFMVKVCGDLADWQPDTVPVGLPRDNTDGTRSVTERDTVPANAASSRFIRLEITRNP